MLITWHGQSAVKIQTETGTVLLDPQTPSSGMKPTRITTDLLLLGSSDSPRGGNEATTFVVEHPGEYEAKDIFVYSVAVTPDQTMNGKAGMIFAIQTEEMLIGHLGFLKTPLTERQQEFFEEADILLLPVGGGDVLTPKFASDVVSALEPRIVVPIHYAIPGSKEKLGAVQPFLKEIGAKEERMEKLRMKKKDLPQEDTRVIVLDFYGKH